MDSLVHIVGSGSIFLALYFEVFLLITLFEKKKEAIKHLDGFTPKVTVIVPCYNEERTLAKTLDSLLALSYPKENLFIIVVNDGSTDNTREALRRYEAHPQIRIFDKENGGKYTALNFGIEKTETEFVGCLDADSFVDAMALQRIMAGFRDAQVMAVTPSMVLAAPNNIIRKMQRAEYSYGNFMRKSFAKLGAVHITPGPFSFFRKEVFAKIGPYRHAYNTEDMEMAMRMQKNGMKIANASDALVFTVGPENVKKLYRQRVRWVSGFISNLIDYRDMLFKKKHGNLGVFILPFSAFGIFISFLFLGISLYQLIDHLTQSIVKLSIVGFTMPKWSLDLFFTDTSIYSLLGTTMVAVIILLVVGSDRITSKKWRFSVDSLYFVFLYSIIAPFWLVTSVYNNIVSKTASWR